ncbi:RdgB/HAM1 family non-canonical purine NTP pyrophosphatase [Flaviflexus ciconiae]|uniref:dITP/XTP pyrophosphatase n=1 Tax=Flaviflexus ciconiae TaxID=2496867 RepID=A0A3Q9G3I0_9ACTO|nr:RdgB/HAM1 family non-canonical purine NTP pyrophosphatase [Flaviflexus ciconiae]AZQ76852.1 RdgB/HAM1 family non-canonical purine NTP pyrophosphatase [Flaviflexus ciconiae]
MILASRNAHKLVEVRQILGREDIDLSPGNLGDPVEDDVTFAGNALIKARYVAERTGEAVIADDSGLCVDVLGGSPGVFSARWCGRHGADDENTDLLLGQLNDVGDDLRQAKFVCAAVYVSPGQPDIIATGIMPGRLIRERRGEGGFGYDPIFVPDGYEQTAAELTSREKNSISHRGQAFRALKAEMTRFGIE